MAMFDTLRASQRLRDEGGFDERQSQAIAGVLGEDLAPRVATRDDLERLMARLDERFEHLEASLKHYVIVRVGVMVGTATTLLLAALAVAVAVLASS
ncbi:MAG: hypothetical protein OXH97_10095 [Chloroflexota bacterium]|nr:hypothetical protein [Chloroflexota bacterium]MDE2696846.1 hypothetical protein [Chloroflexota bacterium]MXZ62456.1 hypothetical protein [Chloroflexota bacterium]MYE32877.1 hypothetical protein [Chloroflexota bacterium]